MRLNPKWLSIMPRRKQFNVLKECARDRSGHAITVLSLFLVPELPMQYQHLIYIAGSLIMYIDDHGDCYFDRHCNRITYMNQVKRPAHVLRKIFYKKILELHKGLPICRGRDILIAFLFRYFVTRLKKHKLEQTRGEFSLAVYE